MSNFFELLNQKPCFDINLSVLESEFIQAQKRAHPDNFINTGGVDLQKHDAHSALINQAYTTLRDPFKRAIYYLSLHDVWIDNTDSIPMPADFLMEQMEFRENLELATTPELKKTLKNQIHNNMQAQYVILRNLLADSSVENLKLAVMVVKKLRFWINIKLHENQQ